MGHDDTVKTENDLPWLGEVLADAAPNDVVDYTYAWYANVTHPIYSWF